MFDLVHRSQDRLRLLLSLTLARESLVRDILPEMVQVAQRILNGYGARTEGLACNMGSLYLGYLLTGNRELFEQARNHLLQQEQDSQPRPTV